MKIRVMVKGIDERASGPDGAHFVSHVVWSPAPPAGQPGAKDARFFTELEVVSYERPKFAVGDTLYLELGS